MTFSELSKSRLWLCGPDWLCASASRDLPDEEVGDDTEVPEECRPERRRQHGTQYHGARIGRLVSCENFSSLSRLLRVTALVLKFTRLLIHKVKGPEHRNSAYSQGDADRARLKDAQSEVQQDPLWKTPAELIYRRVAVLEMG